MRTMARLGCALLMAATLSHAQASKPADQPTTSASPTSHRSAKSKHKKPHKTARRGQQKIDSRRARQIQEALIREHYLTAKPSGVWDGATQAAMQKYQADNGWQSKTTPDSRALIKLGLGPDQEHLLNPQSAMTSQPRAASAPTSSRTTDPPNPPQPQK